MKTLKENISQLNRLHGLIKREATGSPNSLARRFNVSKATIIRYIQSLKEMDAPIEYSRDKCCYYYKHDFDLDLNKF